MRQNGICLVTTDSIWLHLVEKTTILTQLVTAATPSFTAY